MYRRDLLKLLGAAAAVSAAQPETRAAAAPGPWKTAVGLNGFASSPKKYNKTFPIWEVLDFASRTGFDGVELTRGWPMGEYPHPDEKERVAALKRMYDGFGLQVFSIQTNAAGAFDPDPAVRAAWLEDFKENTRFVKALGAIALDYGPAAS